MGAKYFPDKITGITHSGGIVSIGPSYITIAGQQYYTMGLSRAISADVTMTANTLYMIYATMISGVLSLRVSSSARSAYLATNPLSELVGAFYANGQSTIAFGSFVNIIGKPSSQIISNGALSIGAVTTAPSKPTTTLTDMATWQRDGEFLNFAYNLSYSNESGGTAGSDLYLYPIPSSLSIDSSKLTLSSTQTVVGLARAADNGNALIGSAIVYNTGNFIVSGKYSTNGAAGATTISDVAIGSSAFRLSSTNGTTYLNFQARVPISGWSNTQLMDL